MTRLTLDTIALCGFAYRFNSFYQREMHPFVEAMVRALTESGKRTKRLPLANQLLYPPNRQHGTTSATCTR
jgi:cytochrome P450/NADPH-cytochrome P450 reductase